MCMLCILLSAKGKANAWIAAAQRVLEQEEGETTESEKSFK
jgi:hypothetical protein